mmetsp:Transcript_25552/g.41219  ORF Transcript_25552/g.41219 Transcript_25552/m.41219 type:complete len:324 (-) Transcript_25552:654-1625(-)
MAAESSSEVEGELTQKYHPPWIYTLPNLRNRDHCSSSVALHQHPRGYEPNVPIPGELLQEGDDQRDESSSGWSRMNESFINRGDSKPEIDLKYFGVTCSSNDGSSSSSSRCNHSPSSSSTTTKTTTASKSRLRKDLEELEELMELEDLPIIPDFEEENASSRQYSNVPVKSAVAAVDGAGVGHREEAANVRRRNMKTTIHGGVKKRVTFADDAADDVMMVMIKHHQNASGFCVARPEFRGFARVLRSEKKKKEDRDKDEQWAKSAQQTAVCAAAGAVVGAAVGGPMGAFAGAKAENNKKKTASQIGRKRFFILDIINKYACVV